MTRIRYSRVLSFAIPVLAFLFTCAWTSPAKALVTSAKKVKATAKATTPDADGNQTVTVTLKIDKDYHLYANPVGVEDLKLSQTELTISAKEKPKSVKVIYPEGKPYKVGDISFKVYEGTVKLKAKVKRARGDSSPLQLTIRVQACSKNTCLLPDKIKLTAK